MSTPPGSRSHVLAARELFAHESTQLLSALRPLLLALALGALGASLLRRRRLHWSWAPPAAATALVLAPLLGGLGRIAIVAGAVAALRARRGHRDDLEAGADLARAARARVTPLSAARRLGARVVDSRRAPALGRARPGTLLLGRDMRSRPVRVPFDRRLAGHALVVGATGSGKTVTQTLIAERAVQDGRAAIVVDPKGDAAMRRGSRRRPRTPAARSSSGRPAGRARTTPTRAAARRRSPTACLPASASPSLTTCARPSAISVTRSARCARAGARSSLHDDRRAASTRARSSSLLRERRRAMRRSRTRLPRLADAAPAPRPRRGPRPARDPVRVGRRPVAAAPRRRRAAGRPAGCAARSRSVVYFSLRSRQPAAAGADARRRDRPGPPEHGRCAAGRAGARRSS